MRYFLSLFFVLSVLVSMAQPRIVSTENKKAIKTYEEALQALRVNNNQGAITLLRKAIDIESKFLEAFIVLGDTYYQMGDNANALLAYERMMELDPSFYPTASYKIARCYFVLENFEAAEKNAKDFLDLPNKNPNLVLNAEKIYRDAKFAKSAVNEPVPVNLENLGMGVNSRYDEYYPSITADDKNFLFTRKLPFSDNRMFQEDFFVSSRENTSDLWGRAVGISRNINSEYNEGAPSLSADGRVLIFAACELHRGSKDYGKNRTGQGSCDLFYSVKQGDNWSNVYNVGPNVNTSNWESQPSLAPDGRTLYFIRGKSGRGVQGMDIYKSEMTANGEWGKAQKLPEPINTPYDESSVFIHPDNQTLYFSSQGHPGMGGEDIFMSKKDENGNWGEPVNLGYPINTIGPENSFLVSSSGDYAFFASDRDSLGYGGLDIYTFELPDYAKPEKLSYAKGVVRDAETLKPLFALFKLIDISSEEVKVNSTSDAQNGSFLFTLPAGKEYALNVSRPDYLFYSENFVMGANTSLDEAVELEVLLQPIKKGSLVTLKNVFFETASYELLDKSKAELNKLVEFLELNPTLSIEIGGHTDSVGEDADNQKLSENRAKSVVAYLVKNGIEATRLSHVGYGETVPKASNDTPEGRAKNRRTEFKVM